MSQHPLTNNVLQSRVLGEDIDDGNPGHIRSIKRNPTVRICSALSIKSNT